MTLSDASDRVGEDEDISPDPSRGCEPHPPSKAAASMPAITKFKYCCTSFLLITGLLSAFRAKIANNIDNKKIMTNALGEPERRKCQIGLKQTGIFLHWKACPAFHLKIVRSPRVFKEPP